MGHPVGFEGGSGVVDGTHEVHTFLRVEPVTDQAAPPPTLQVHGLVAIPFKPALPLLAGGVLGPGSGEGGAVGRGREGADEGGEGKVVVAAEEDVGLGGVEGGKGEEEVEDEAGVGAAVAVVAEEDDEGGVEGRGGDGGAEVGPEGAELGVVAMDVPHAYYHPLLLASFATSPLLPFHFHFPTYVRDVSELNRILDYIIRLYS